jgi:hypothetical protein
MKSIMLEELASSIASSLIGSLRSCSYALECARTIPAIGPARWRALQLVRKIVS